MSLPFTPACEMHSLTLLTACSHHDSGSCSAHPGWGAAMAISSFGDWQEASVFAPFSSTRQAFTDELPISRPSKYLMLLVSVVPYSQIDHFKGSIYLNLNN